MLKVVGASWLQTRVSTFILIAVSLFGIGAIVLSEFGCVEKDGIYSATVSWSHRERYRIDFWGQGNDLAGVQLNAARAYYKTGISETGWSIIEIETSSKYPDIVQAYAAGLLEGSLTWQSIHHHWHNTFNTVCEKRISECRKLMQFLRENTSIIRERAEALASADPFWHMIRLFYAQLDGLEAGWRFAVRRSRQTIDMESEHFLWLAMAADLPDLERELNVRTIESSHSYRDYAKSMIFLKKLNRTGLEPLIAIGHATAAPYTKMLRLLKKYTFGYHVLPISKTSALVPGRSIVMSSYPGALSSHDEFYLIQGENRELIVAGTSDANHTLWNFMNTKDQVMTSVKVMATNRLANDGRFWSRGMSLHENGMGPARQWVALEPRTSNVWIVEHRQGISRAINVSGQFVDTGVLWSTGETSLRDSINIATNESNKDDDVMARIQRNVTTMERFNSLMRGYSHDEPTTGGEGQKIQNFKEDLEEMAVPFGVIDAKIVLTNTDGVESFEATSGPSKLDSEEPFRWSTTFPNVSHIGQPDVFDFESVTPLWVWL